jgi:NAD(P)-dependent dehydrogenase (short-subunit alcohol dehydrogenase family)
MTNLTGQVALVTGAGSGIGAATASELAQAGAKVCCADLDELAAARVAETIIQSGGEATTLAVNVADVAENEAMVAAVVERFGAPHIAHLNAGVHITGSIFKTTPEQWDSVLEVNLRGTFFGLKFAGGQIVESGGGSVIITSSGAGLLGAAGGSAYTASNHGVLGLMKYASAELAPLGVRVKAICPGIINTPMLGPLHAQDEGVPSALGASQPIGRLGTAVEVAKLVVFLAGAEASFITRVHDSRGRRREQRIWKLYQRGSVDACHRRKLTKEGGE